MFKTHILYYKKQTNKKLEILARLCEIKSQIELPSTYAKPQVFNV